MNLEFFSPLRSLQSLNKYVISYHGAHSCSFPAAITFPFTSHPVTSCRNENINFFFFVQFPENGRKLCMRILYSIWKIIFQFQFKSSHTTAPIASKWKSNEIAPKYQHMNYSVNEVDENSTAIEASSSNNKLELRWKGIKINANESFLYMKIERCWFLLRSA